MFSELSKVIETRCYEARISYVLTDLVCYIKYVYLLPTSVCYIHGNSKKSHWRMVQLAFVSYSPLSDVKFHILAFTHTLSLFQLCYPPELRKFPSSLYNILDSQSL